MATQQIPQIQVETRTGKGTRDAVRLREAGRLPAVIYGHKQEPAHVSFDAKEINDLLHSHAHLIEAQVAGKAEPCLIKDVQWDYLGSNIIHIDLNRVDLDEKVSVQVDVEFTGEPVGLKEAGAFMEHPNTSIEIQCKASEIPENIKVDMSELGVGGTITVGDVDLPAGVEAAGDRDLVLAAIHVSVAEEEAGEGEGEAAADGAEPEVIGRKPEDGDGGGDS